MRCAALSSTFALLFSLSAYAAADDCRVVDQMVRGPSGELEPTRLVLCEAKAEDVLEVMKQSAATCAEAQALLEDEEAARVCGLETQAARKEIEELAPISEARE